jgi:hypothetical protein
VSVEGAGKHKSVIKASLSADLLIAARSPTIKQGGHSSSVFTKDGDEGELRRGEYSPRTAIGFA